MGEVPFLHSFLGNQKGIEKSIPKILAKQQKQLRRTSYYNTIFPLTKKPFAVVLVYQKFVGCYLMLIVYLPTLSKKVVNFCLIGRSRSSAG